MFEVSRWFAIGGDDRPTVIEDTDFRDTRIDHGFDRKSHPWHESWGFAAWAEVWNLGFFVKFSTDAMADEFADYGETKRLGILGDGAAEIGELATECGEEPPDLRITRRAAQEDQADGLSVPARRHCA